MPAKKKKFEHSPKIVSLHEALEKAEIPAVLDEGYDAVILPMHGHDTVWLSADEYIWGASFDYSAAMPSHVVDQIVAGKHA